MAADKSQIREWPFAGVSWCAARPVVKPVSDVGQAVLGATMLACTPCEQAWSLFESGDDYNLFILFQRSRVRATAPTAATRSACAARCAT